MLPAFAREDFEWEGHQIKEGQRVIIDILGTNTDPNEWEEPLRFKPERFLGVEDAEADGEDLSVEEPAQALIDRAHSPARATAAARVVRRVRRADMVFSFIVVG